MRKLINDFRRRTVLEKDILRSQRRKRTKNNIAIPKESFRK